MTLLAAENGTLRPNLTLIIVAAVLIACGVYLLLERALTRIVLGIILVGNGIALLYVVTIGEAKGAPLMGERPPEDMSDPLPMAMVLTAIVIALATVSFGLALAYRQWQLTGSDDIPDDLEDAAIQRLARRDQVSSTYEESTESTTEAEEDAVEGGTAEPGIEDADEELAAREHPEDRSEPAAVSATTDGDLFQEQADRAADEPDQQTDGGERR